MGEPLARSEAEIGKNSPQTSKGGRRHETRAKVANAVNEDYGNVTSAMERPVSAAASVTTPSRTMRSLVARCRWAGVWETIQSRAAWGTSSDLYMPIPSNLNITRERGEDYALESPQRHAPPTAMGTALTLRYHERKTDRRRSHAS